MSNINISNVINVTLMETSKGLSSANMNALALFTNETPIHSLHNGYGIYNNASSLAEDFGSNSETYAQGAAIFSQTPNILSVSGYLVVIAMLPTRSATSALLCSSTSVSTSTLSGLTSGNYNIKINGTGYVVVLGSGSTADSIVTAFNTVSGISGTYTLSQKTDSTGVTFSLKTVATGKSASLSIGSASSKDLAKALHISGNAIGQNAQTAETLKDAIIRTQTQIFYLGIIHTVTLSDTELLDLSTYVQTLDKIIFATSYDTNTLGDTGVFSKIKDKENSHTRCLLYVGSDISDKIASMRQARLMAAAYASRALSTDFNGSDTTSTMQLKSLKTITPDAGLTQTIIQNADTIGVDVYAGFDSVSGILSSGKNHYFDSVYNGLWFKLALQVAGFNYLKQTNSKIPQTEGGMTGLKNAFVRICQTAVLNTYLSPGIWTAPDTFGNPELFKENIQQTGYYVWSSPISMQSQTERNDRQAPLIQIAVKTAGAIHSVNVIVNINQ